jgi:galactose mutarotase-like enzyme
MFTIENEVLRVTIKPRGAELSSIFSKETGLEYLWNGDARYWNKQSPVLFPIVGTLKKNTYYYRGVPYTLGRHGFARDKNFICSMHDQASVIMSLMSDEDTFRVYPFRFRLDIIYSIDRNCLRVRYRVTNTQEGDMYFSIGGHPAFRIPLTEDLEYDDYYLDFENKEFAMRWPISSEGLIEATPLKFLHDSKKLRLSKDLFLNDAIVFKHLNSHKVSIRSDKSPHGVQFHFPRFPYLGIWAFPYADFVCIEPWCGIADSVTSKQLLESKEGINFLPGGEIFERTWSAEFT